MKVFLLLILLVLVLLYLGYVQTRGTQSIASPQQNRGEVYELQVGDKVYEVVLNHPLIITTPKGETIELLLRRKKVLHYSGQHLAFDYPAALNLSSETENEVTTLTLEGVASPFVLLQIYPPSNTAEEVLANLLNAFESEYASRQAQFLSGNKGTVSRQIGGATRQGRILKFNLAGQQMVTEIYAFPKNEVVVALILQHDIAEAALAEDYFAIITQSLR